MSSVYDDVGWFDNGLTEEAINELTIELETKVSKLDDDIGYLIADIKNVLEEWKERDTMSETIVYVDSNLQDFAERLEKIAERLY